MLPHLTQLFGGKELKAKIDNISPGAKHIGLSNINGNITIDSDEAVVYRPVGGSYIWKQAGVYSFAVPADVYILYVDLLIGGGGGGGGAMDSTKKGGNGGRGQVLYNYLLKVNPGDVILVTIGAGGLGGAAGQNGTAGGTTSIGTLLAANGGGYGPYWNASTGNNGVNGTNESPFLESSIKYGVPGVGAKVKASGTNGTCGYCSISW